MERPEQNSVVEQKHQHLLNVARALYFQSQVPIEFWGDCLSTATFIINKPPTSNLSNGLSPFELLYNKLPDYMAMRSFGYLYFASSLPSECNKFSPRAIPSISVGYPQVAKNTNFIICKIGHFLYLEIWYSMKKLFHFMSMKNLLISCVLANILLLRVLRSHYTLQLIVYTPLRDLVWVFQTQTLKSIYYNQTR